MLDKAAEHSRKNSMSLAMRFYWAIALAALLAAYVRY